MITKKFKNYLQVATHSYSFSTVLFLLRLIVGVAFVLHGWGKIQTPFAWIPAQAGMTIPGFFQFLAAISEFGGGMALVLGLLTRFGSLGIFFTMGVAVYIHLIVMKDPFVNPTGANSYELPLVYWGIALLFVVLGPGKFSLDAQIFGERDCSEGEYEFEK